MRGLALLMVVAGCHAATQHPGDGGVAGGGGEDGAISDGRDLSTAARDLAGRDFAGADLASTPTGGGGGGARPDMALPAVGSARTPLFYAAQNFKTGGYAPGALARGDFNGDGRDDLVVCDGKANVMLANSDG